MSKRSPAALFAAAVVLVAGSSVLAFQPERPAGQPPQQGQPGQPAQQGQPGQPAQQGQPGQPGEPEQRGPRGPGGRGAGMQIPVEQAMNIMKRSMRQLSGQVTDATKRDQNLLLVNAMQMGCVAAKGQSAPQEILDQAADDAARGKLAEEYRRELMKTMRLLVDLEGLVMDGKGEEAKTKLDEIAALRDHAHEEMGIKDE